MYEIIGATAGALTAGSVFVQSVKANKISTDHTILFFTYHSGTALWLVYSTYNQLPLLCFYNTIVLIQSFIAFLVVLWKHYKIEENA